MEEARSWSPSTDVALDRLRAMLINRVAGLVLPFTSKFLVDDVITQHKTNLLMPLAAFAVVMTIIQGGTSFALSQVVSIAAQRAITEMRKRVQAHVLRLPVSYFDSTKTGVLISRVMTDAEGVRNLVGPGLIQLVGSADRRHVARRALLL
jgi:subfamily B ATP-binding cassette protein MsbA